jgi:hypothetical protein
MALFYVHNPATGAWLGPVESAAIRRAVTDGRIEPTREVWSGLPADATLPAGSPELAPFNWGGLLLAIGVGTLAGLAVGAVITA